MSLRTIVHHRSALEFVWSQESSDYAIRESGGRVKVFKNFTEKATVKIEYAIEGMHGGALVGEQAGRAAHASLAALAPKPCRHPRRLVVCHPNCAGDDHMHA